MDWGDAPGWAGALLGAGALVVSIQAWRSGKAAADRANDAADRSAASSHRAAEAAERSARAAEETLADQRAATAPRVDIVLERVNGMDFVLRNVGQLTATNVVAHAAPGWTVVDAPQGVTLRPGEGHALSFPQSFPPHLLVHWHGEPEPNAVPVPSPR